MITFVLLYALMVLSFNNAYDFTCPSQGHWKLRAVSMCMHESNYSCLYDVNLQVNVYRDKCIRPRIVGHGYKYVFQPNPNRGTCSLTRYQPFIFNTTGYSDCAFQKSICSSEGQTTYTSGTTISDRTCSCNTDTGHVFIRNPAHGCYCNPLSEDCSCYIRIKEKDNDFDPKDVNCEHEMKMTETRPREDTFNTSRKIKNHDFDNYKYNLGYLPTNEYRIEAAKCVLMIILAYCFIGVILQNIMRRGIRKRRWQKEIRALETSGEHPNKRIKDTTEELKIEKDNVIPSNINDQTRKSIDEWEVKSKSFVETRAYIKVLEEIVSNSCVAVTGPSGAGKSAIVQAVSLSLSKENGYKIIKLLCPMDLRNYYSPGKKTVFILEDFCGKFTAREDQINDWCSMQDVVNQVVEDESCKILFSCRLQVYKDPKFDLLPKFQLCECNIISSELCLTEDEKKQIFNSHLSSEKITDNILFRKIDNFPFLCQYRSIGKNNLDIDKYFVKPYQVYRDELNKLKGQRKEKLCGLCLCVIFNNKLKDTCFEICTQEFKNIINDICESIGLNNHITAISLREELDTLENTYVKKHGELYAICHDALFDFMAYYFGNMMTQCFIKHADSGFLCERFLWKNAFDTECDENKIENIVHFKDCHLKYYIDRMISDWKNGNVSDVLTNINMVSSSFRKEFLNRLNQLDMETSILLSQRKDGFRKDFASGNTPLIITCFHGYVDILKWLLKNKADVNVCRNDGSSALYMGCFFNNVDIVNILLENGADVNACTSEGVSPLGITCSYNGNLKIVTALLEKKAKVNEHRVFKTQMTPLFMACTDNYIPIVQELLKHNANPNICTSNGMSPLLDACQKGYTDMVDMLIKYKANPNSEMQDGDTPLFSASWMGFAKITKMLLDDGADPTICLKSKEAILELPEYSRKNLEHYELIWFEAVLKNIASPKVKEYVQNKSADYVYDVFAGSSPLHVACFMGQIDVIKLLTEKLKVVDVLKNDGTAPLFYACELGHLDIVKILVGKGANPDLKRNDNISSSMIAKENGHTELLPLLRS